MADEGEDGSNQPIGEVLVELHRRARTGFRHAPFQLAFWFGLVLAGGLGVWLEAYRLLTDPASTSVAPLRTAVSTFFPAVIGATALQIASRIP